MELRYTPRFGATAHVSDRFREKNPRDAQILEAAFERNREGFEQLPGNVDKVVLRDIDYPHYGPGQTLFQEKVVDIMGTNGGSSTLKFNEIFYKALSLGDAFKFKNAFTDPDYMDRIIKERLLPFIDFRARNSSSLPAVPQDTAGN